MELNQQLLDAIDFLEKHPISPEGASTRDTPEKLRSYITNCEECAKIILLYISDVAFREENPDGYKLALNACKKVFPSTAEVIEEAYKELDERTSLED